MQVPSDVQHDVVGGRVDNVVDGGRSNKGRQQLPPEAKEGPYAAAVSASGAAPPSAAFSGVAEIPPGTAAKPRLAAVDSVAVQATYAGTALSAASKAASTDSLLLVEDAPPAIIGTDVENTGTRPTSKLEEDPATARADGGSGRQSKPAKAVGCLKCVFARTTGTADAATLQLGAMEEDANAYVSVDVAAPAVAAAAECLPTTTAICECDKPLQPMGRRSFLEGLPLECLYAILSLLDLGEIPLLRLLSHAVRTAIDAPSSLLECSSLTITSAIATDSSAPPSCTAARRLHVLKDAHLSRRRQLLLQQCYGQQRQKHWDCQLGHQYHCCGWQKQDRQGSGPNRQPHCCLEEPQGHDTSCWQEQQREERQRQLCGQHPHRDSHNWLLCDEQQHEQKGQREQEHQPRHTGRAPNGSREHAGLCIQQPGRNLDEHTREGPQQNDNPQQCEHHRLLEGEQQQGQEKWLQQQQQRLPGNSVMHRSSFWKNLLLRRPHLRNLVICRDALPSLNTADGSNTAGNMSSCSTHNTGTSKCTCLTGTINNGTNVLSGKSPTETSECNCFRRTSICSSNTALGDGGIHDSSRPSGCLYSARLVLLLRLIRHNAPVLQHLKLTSPDLQCRHPGDCCSVRMPDYRQLTLKGGTPVWATRFPRGSATGQDTCRGTNGTSAATNLLLSTEQPSALKQEGHCGQVPPPVKWQHCQSSEVQPQQRSQARPHQQVTQQQQRGLPLERHQLGRSIQHWGISDALSKGQPLAHSDSSRPEQCSFCKAKQNPGHNEATDAASLGSQEENAVLVGRQNRCLQQTSDTKRTATLPCAAAPVDAAKKTDWHSTAAVSTGKNTYYTADESLVVVRQASTNASAGEDTLAGTAGRGAPGPAVAPEPQKEALPLLFHRSADASLLKTSSAPRSFSTVLAASSTCHLADSSNNCCCGSPVEKLCFPTSGGCSRASIQSCTESTDMHTVGGTLLSLGVYSYEKEEQQRCVQQLQQQLATEFSQNHLPPQEPHTRQRILLQQPPRQQAQEPQVRGQQQQVQSEPERTLRQKYQLQQQTRDPLVNRPAHHHHLRQDKFQWQQDRSGQHSLQQQLQPPCQQQLQQHEAIEQHCVPPVKNHHGQRRLPVQEQHIHEESPPKESVQTLQVGCRSLSSVTTSRIMTHDACVSISESHVADSGSLVADRAASVALPPSTPTRAARPSPAGAPATRASAASISESTGASGALLGEGSIAADANDVSAPSRSAPNVSFTHPMIPCPTAFVSTRLPRVASACCYGPAARTKGSCTTNATPFSAAHSSSLAAGASVGISAATVVSLHAENVDFPQLRTIQLLGCHSFFWLQLLFSHSSLPRCVEFSLVSKCPALHTPRPTTFAPADSRSTVVSASNTEHVPPSEADAPVSAAPATASAVTALSSAYNPAAATCRGAAGKGLSAVHRAAHYGPACPGPPAATRAGAPSGTSGVLSRASIALSRIDGAPIHTAAVQSTFLTATGSSSLKEKYVAATAVHPTGADSGRPAEACDLDVEQVPSSASAIARRTTVDVVERTAIYAGPVRKAVTCIAANNNPTKGPTVSFCESAIADAAAAEATGEAAASDAMKAAGHLNCKCSARTTIARSRVTASCTQIAATAFASPTINKDLKSTALLVRPPALGVTAGVRTKFLSSPSQRLCTVAAVPVVDQLSAADARPTHELHDAASILIGAGPCSGDMALQSGSNSIATYANPSIYGASRDTGGVSIAAGVTVTSIPSGGHAAADVSRATAHGRRRAPISGARFDDDLIRMLRSAPLLRALRLETCLPVGRAVWKALLTGCHPSSKNSNGDSESRNNGGSGRKRDIRLTWKSTDGEDREGNYSVHSGCPQNIDRDIRRGLGDSPSSGCLCPWLEDLTITDRSVPPLVEVLRMLQNSPPASGIPAVRAAPAAAATRFILGDRLQHEQSLVHCGGRAAPALVASATRVLGMRDLSYPGGHRHIKSVSPCAPVALSTAAVADQGVAARAASTAQAPTATAALLAATPATYTAPAMPTVEEVVEVTPLAAAPTAKQAPARISPGPVSAPGASSSKRLRALVNVVDRSGADNADLQPAQTTTATETTVTPSPQIAAKCDVAADAETAREASRCTAAALLGNDRELEGKPLVQRRDTSCKPDLHNEHCSATNDSTKVTAAAVMGRAAVITSEAHKSPYIATPLALISSVPPACAAARLACAATPANNQVLNDPAAGVTAANRITHATTRAATATPAAASVIPTSTVSLAQATVPPDAAAAAVSASAALPAAVSSISPAPTSSTIRAEADAVSVAPIFPGVSAAAPSLGISAALSGVARSPSVATSIDASPLSKSSGRVTADALPIGGIVPVTSGASMLPAMSATGFPPASNCETTNLFEGNSRTHRSIDFSSLPTAEARGVLLWGRKGLKLSLRRSRIGGLEKWGLRMPAVLCESLQQLVLSCAPSCEIYLDAFTATSSSSNMNETSTGGGANHGGGGSSTFMRIWNNNGSNRNSSGHTILHEIRSSNNQSSIRAISNNSSAESYGQRLSASRTLPHLLSHTTSESICSRCRGLAQACLFRNRCSGTGCGGGYTDSNEISRTCGCSSQRTSVPVTEILDGDCSTVYRPNVTFNEGSSCCSKPNSFFDSGDSGSTATAFCTLPCGTSPMSCISRCCLKGSATDRSNQSVCSRLARKRGCGGRTRSKRISRTRRNGTEKTGSIHTRASKRQRTCDGRRCSVLCSTSDRSGSEVIRPGGTSYRKHFEPSRSNDQEEQTRGRTRSTSRKNVRIGGIARHSRCSFSNTLYSKRKKTRCLAAFSCTRNQLVVRSTPPLCRAVRSEAVPCGKEGIGVFVAARAGAQAAGGDIIPLVGTAATATTNTVAAETAAEAATSPEAADAAGRSKTAARCATGAPKGVLGLNSALLSRKNAIAGQPRRRRAAENNSRSLADSETALVAGPLNSIEQSTPLGHRKRPESGSIVRGECCCGSSKALRQAARARSIVKRASTGQNSRNQTRIFHDTSVNAFSLTAGVLPSATSLLPTAAAVDALTPHAAADFLQDVPRRGSFAAAELQGRATTQGNLLAEADAAITGENERETAAGDSTLERSLRQVRSLRLVYDDPYHDIYFTSQQRTAAQRRQEQLSRQLHTPRQPCCGHHQQHQRTLEESEQDVHRPQQPQQQLWQKQQRQQEKQNRKQITEVVTQPVEEVPRQPQHTVADTLSREQQFPSKYRRRPVGTALQIKKEEWQQQQPPQAQIRHPETRPHRGSAGPAEHHHQHINTPADGHYPRQVHSGSKKRQEGHFQPDVQPQEVSRLPPVHQKSLLMHQSATTSRHSVDATDLDTGRRRRQQKPYMKPQHQQLTRQLSQQQQQEFHIPAPQQSHDAQDQQSRDSLLVKKLKSRTLPRSPWNPLADQKCPQEATGSPDIVDSNPHSINPIRPSTTEVSSYRRNSDVKNSNSHRLRKSCLSCTKSPRHSSANSNSDGSTSNETKNKITNRRTRLTGDGRRRQDKPAAEELVQIAVPCCTQYQQQHACKGAGLPECCSGMTSFSRGNICSKRGRNDTEREQGAARRSMKIYRAESSRTSRTRVRSHSRCCRSCRLRKSDRTSKKHMRCSSTRLCKISKNCNRANIGRYASSCIRRDGDFSSLSSVNSRVGCRASHHTNFRCRPIFTSEIGVSRHITIRGSSRPIPCTKCCGRSAWGRHHDARSSNHSTRSNSSESRKSNKNARRHSSNCITRRNTGGLQTGKIETHSLPPSTQSCGRGSFISSIQRSLSVPCCSRSDIKSTPGRLLPWKNPKHLAGKKRRGVSLLASPLECASPQVDCHLSAATEMQQTGGKRNSTNSDRSAPAAAQGLGESYECGKVTGDKKSRWRATRIEQAATTKQAKRQECIMMQEDVRCKRKGDIWKEAHSEDEFEEQLSAMQNGRRKGKANKVVEKGRRRGDNEGIKYNAFARLVSKQKEGVGKDGGRDAEGKGYQRHALIQTTQSGGRPAREEEEGRALPVPVKVVGEGEPKIKKEEEQDHREQQSNGKSVDGAVKKREHSTEDNQVEYAVYVAPKAASASIKEKARSGRIEVKERRRVGRKQRKAGEASGNTILAVTHEARKRSRECKKTPERRVVKKESNRRIAYKCGEGGTRGAKRKKRCTGDEEERERVVHHVDCERGQREEEAERTERIVYGGEDSEEHDDKELLLLPVLRRLSIDFFHYSPHVHRNILRCRFGAAAVAAAAAAKKKPATPSVRAYVAAAPLAVAPLASAATRESSTVAPMSVENTWGLSATTSAVNCCCFEGDDSEIDHGCKDSTQERGMPCNYSTRTTSRSKSKHNESPSSVRTGSNVRSSVRFNDTNDELRTSHSSENSDWDSDDSYNYNCPSFCVEGLPYVSMCTKPSVLPSTALQTATKSAAVFPADSTAARGAASADISGIFVAARSLSAAATPANDAALPPAASTSRRAFTSDGGTVQFSTTETAVALFQSPTRTTPGKANVITAAGVVDANSSALDVCAPSSNEVCNGPLSLAAHTSSSGSGAYSTARPDGLTAFLEWTVLPLLRSPAFAAFVLVVQQQPPPLPFLPSPVASPVFAVSPTVPAGPALAPRAAEAYSFLPFLSQAAASTELPAEASSAERAGDSRSTSNASFSSTSSQSFIRARSFSRATTRRSRGSESSTDQFPISSVRSNIGSSAARSISLKRGTESGNTRQEDTRMDSCSRHTCEQKCYSDVPPCTVHELNYSSPWNSGKPSHQQVSSTPAVARLGVSTVAPAEERTASSNSINTTARAKSVVFEGTRPGITGGKRNTHNGGAGTWNGGSGRSRSSSKHAEMQMKNMSAGPLSSSKRSNLSIGNGGNSQAAFGGSRATRVSRKRSSWCSSSSRMWRERCRQQQRVDAELLMAICRDVSTRRKLQGLEVRLEALLGSARMATLLEMLVSFASEEKSKRTHREHKQKHCAEPVSQYQQQQRWQQHVLAQHVHRLGQEQPGSAQRQQWHVQTKPKPAKMRVMSLQQDHQMSSLQQQQQVVSVHQQVFCAQQQTELQERKGRAQLHHEGLQGQQQPTRQEMDQRSDQERRSRHAAQEEQGRFCVGKQQKRDQHNVQKDQQLLLENYHSPHDATVKAGTARSPQASAAATSAVSKTALRTATMPRATAAAVTLPVEEKETSTTAAAAISSGLPSPEIAVGVTAPPSTGTTHAANRKVAALHEYSTSLWGSHNGRCATPGAPRLRLMRISNKTITLRDILVPLNPTLNEEQQPESPQDGQATEGDGEQEVAEEERTHQHQQGEQQQQQQRQVVLNPENLAWQNTKSKTHRIKHTPLQEQVLGRAYNVERSVAASDLSENRQTEATRDTKDASDARSSELLLPNRNSSGSCFGLWCNSSTFAGCSCFFPNACNGSCCCSASTTAMWGCCCCCFSSACSCSSANPCSWRLLLKAADSCTASCNTVADFVLSVNGMKLLHLLHDLMEAYPHIKRVEATVPPFLFDKDEAAGFHEEPEQLHVLDLLLHAVGFCRRRVSSRANLFQDLCAQTRCKEMQVTTRSNTETAAMEREEDGFAAGRAPEESGLAEGSRITASTLVDALVASKAHEAAQEPVVRDRDAADIHGSRRNSGHCTCCRGLCCAEHAAHSHVCALVHSSALSLCTHKQGRCCRVSPTRPTATAVPSETSHSVVSKLTEPASASCAASDPPAPLLAATVNDGLSYSGRSYRVGGAAPASHVGRTRVCLASFADSSSVAHSFESSVFRGASPSAAAFAEPPLLARSERPCDAAGVSALSRAAFAPVGTFSRCPRATAARRGGASVVAEAPAAPEISAYTEEVVYYRLPRIRREARSARCCSAGEPLDFCDAEAKMAARAD